MGEDAERGRAKVKMGIIDPVVERLRYDDAELKPAVNVRVLGLRAPRPRVQEEGTAKVGRCSAQPRADEAVLTSVSNTTMVQEPSMF